MANYTLRIERSGAHCHLSKGDFAHLFPVNGTRNPEKLRDLSIPGEYVLDQRVELITKKGRLDLAVLLPTRTHSVIELSRSQAIKLGVKEIATGLTSDKSMYTEYDNLVMLAANGQVMAVPVVVQIPHLHVPMDFETSIDEDVADVYINGESCRVILYDVPIKRNEGLTECLLHLDDDTYNGLVTMNLGSEKLEAHLKS